MKLTNDWTMERVIELITKYVPEERSPMTVEGGYAYMAGDRRCAVGCFIPDGHAGLKNQRWVYGLLEDYPDLKMPFGVSDLELLQKFHDTAEDPNLRSGLIKMVQE